MVILILFVFNKEISKHNGQQNQNQQDDNEDTRYHATSHSIEMFL